MIPTAFLTVSVDKIQRIFFCLNLMQNSAYSMVITVSATIMQPQINEEVGCG